MKTSSKKIAIERIENLFRMAEEEVKSGNLEQGKKCVTLAVKIAKKYNVSLSKYKRCFCKKCGNFINLKTARIRFQKKDSRMTYTCLECGNVQRYPYIKEKLKKRKF